MEEKEVMIRLGFFLGIFAVLAFFETRAPRRVLTAARKSRWFNNLALVSIDSALVRLVFPVFPLGLSLIARDHQWGLMNQFNLSPWLAVPAGIVILDFFLYLQHVMFHFVPTLWRLHMVHHSDMDFDLTTGVRFHPVEMILSMGIKLSVVRLFGLPVLGVLLFEIILNGMAMFSHSNIRLPLAMDRSLRLVIVTPDMHRVHHSVIIRERNSNFGFNISVWDRLMGTYRGQPGKGHEGIIIGTANLRDLRQLSLLKLLTLPFSGQPA
jgi:sterol desaturase/sphingolipid hydroxylase (fatty acid hydroxylase superfamily)